jgi:hypothetical protein
MVQLEGLGKFKKINGLIGTRTRDLPACRIATQPLAHEMEKYFPLHMTKNIQDTNTCLLLSRQEYPNTDIFIYDSDIYLENGKNSLIHTD